MKRPPRNHIQDLLAPWQLFLYSYVWTGLPISIVCIFAYLLVFWRYQVISVNFVLQILLTVTDTDSNDAPLEHDVFQSFI